ncbi:hypothetical protein WT27_13145 [Burkholderia territorii]|uniref:Uncharacterized protein n=1 Tax=Burkholderia territorii TaxID=1503055 RepID=A0A119DK39_9BURK|nr:hypothetical protein [Burkholderia territorii]KVV40868.1 hypothetical protein WT27_13145 [Burkholderia territorii]KVX33815.1 hypothetical protein WT31_09045 [Burkholderia territorii]
MFDNNRKTVLIAAAVTAILIFIGNILTNGGNAIVAGLSALLSVPFFLIGTRTLRRYRASLAERAELLPTDAANVVWDVYMNDIRVATITDDRLAAFQSQVADDWRNMVTQALNVLRVPLRMFDQFAVVIPAIAFWLILACALLAPDTLVSTLAAVQHASSQELHQGVALAMYTLFTIGLLTFIVHWVFTGYTYGLRNVYRDELEYVLRRYLKIAATGRLTISRLSHDAVYIYEPDLFGWLRAHTLARRTARTGKV